MRFVPASTLLVCLLAVPAAQNSENLDHATLGQIRDEGLSRSRGMDHISWLADTVMTVFAYNASMRDEKLPLKALPRPQGGGRAPGTDAR